MDKKGFTLLELLLLMIALSLVLAIGIPMLLRTRIAINEGATIGSLRTLYTSQINFTVGSVMGPKTKVDQDNDWVGEFGTLGELAGTAIPRGCKNTVSPCLIPQVFGPTGSNISQRRGYKFQIFLPNRGNKTLSDHGTSTVSILHPTKDKQIIDAQEKNFRAYAWPIERKKTGNRIFVVSNLAMVLFAENTKTQYSGTQKRPPFNAAVDAKWKHKDKVCNFQGPFVPGALGIDGQKWEPVVRRKNKVD